jgi:PAS domain S-box-containing protein
MQKRRKKRNITGRSPFQPKSVKRQDRAQSDMFKLMREAARTLTVTLSEKKLASSVVDLCARFPGIRLVWMGLAEPDGTVRQIARHPKNSKYLRGISVRWDETPLGRGPTGRAFRSGSPVVLQDVAGDPSYAPWVVAARNEGFCTSAAFPLVVRGKVLGTLNLYSSRQGFFSEDNVAFFEGFTNQAAVALENIRLFEKEKDHTADFKRRVRERTAELHVAGSRLRKEVAEHKQTKEVRDRLFDVTPSLLCIADIRSMHLLYANPAVEHMTGFPLEQLQSKSPSEFLHPDDVEAFIKAYRNEKGLRKLVGFEHRLKARDGSYRWVSADLVFSKQRGLCYSAGRDITREKEDAKRIADDLELRRKIIETAPIGIALFKASSGDCVMANETLMRITGYRTFDDLMKNNFRRNKSWKKAGLLAAAEKALSTGVPGKIEVNETTDPGKRVSVDAYLAPMMFEGESHLLFEVVDLMDVKTMQEEREKAVAVAGAARMAARTIESMLDPVMITDMHGRITHLNNAFRRALGYDDEMIGRHPSEMVHGNELPKMRDGMKRLMSEKSVKNIEVNLMKKNGGTVPMLMSVTLMEAAGDAPPHGIAVFRDISERKQMEEALKSSEERFRIASQSVNDVIWDWDVASGKLEWVGDIDAILGYPPGRFPRTIEAWANIIHPDDYERVKTAHDSHFKDRKLYSEEYRVRKKDGAYVYWRDSGVALRNESGECVRMVGAVSDITRRKHMEEQLRSVNERLQFVLSSMTDAYFALNLQWQFVELNPTAQVQLFKRPASELVGKVIWTEYPGMMDGSLHKYFRRALAKSQPAHFEEKFAETERWFEIHAYPGKDRLDVYLIDVTKRKRAEEEQGRLLDELKRSNAELEQFAYVASHDLQEPLRMVSNYIQILSSRYQGKMDKDADEFIQYAVDGSIRMQKMISGLLDFSRAGRFVDMLTAVNLETVVANALDNLQFAIEDSHAVVTHDPLPIVLADESSMIQLFQNLISNAIKFQEPGQEPKIEIGVKREGDEWLFAVRDNGIGFDPKDKERIFQIFQRLNERTKYPGIGVGLAITKKILERYEGRIWAESSISKGATFYFSLPVKELQPHP